MPVNDTMLEGVIFEEKVFETLNVYDVDGLAQIDILADGE